MAYLDIMAAGKNAYKTCWEERRYLLRLAAFPFLIKLTSFIFAASYFSDQSSSIRFLLVLVPALIVEGWMLSHLVRLIVLGNRWPFKPTGNHESDFAVLSVRARGILSGMIVYTLINMVVGLLGAAFISYMTPYLPQDGGETPDIPPQMAFLSLAVLTLSLWGFRFLWLYIPYALNLKPQAFLNPLRGLSTSFHLMGVWFLCFIPCFLSVRFLAVLIIAPLGDSSMATFVALFFTVLADTLKTILTTAGITYAYMNLVEKDGTPDLMR